MASIALEEKITKIRLRNEEIKRRYEEVEADKKNAAELDALMKPVPSEDWPTRKEPPEFSAPLAKHTPKPKNSIRKHADQPAQHYTGSTDGKKNHTFADGQGPPPDPKYNFLADSEREEPSVESPKDSERTRARNKSARGLFKRRGSGREWSAKEHWNQYEAFGNPTHPEYEAWRAERNRIDEARISRQRTAEGNWRREWDNDKIHLVDETTKRENRITLGEVVTRQEHNDKEHYRSPRAATRLPHPTIAHESHQATAFAEPIRNHGGAVDSEKRVVIATEKSIKVLLNAQTPTPPRSSVMSVKVSPPNIAGSGRVGPRQRARVTYSSQSEADSSPISDNPSIVRQKSIDESSRVRSFDQAHKISSPRSPRHQRKNEFKNSYAARKEDAMHPGTPRSSRKESERFDETTGCSKKESQKSPYMQKRAIPSNQPSKSSRDQRKSSESFRNDLKKSPRAEEKMIFESDEAFRGIDENSDAPAPTADTSSPNDNPNESKARTSQAEAKADKNESSGNSAARNAESETPLDTAACSIAQKNQQSLANYSPGSSKNNENEKTSHANLNDESNRDNSLDDIESSDNETPNCSVDSGLISNDSGYVELPSNDSIHDVSSNEDAAARENDESPRRSIPSTSRIEENTVDEIRQIQSAQTNTNNAGVDVALTSSNDFQAEVDHLESQLFDENADSREDEANDPGSDGIESRVKKYATMEEPEVFQATEELEEVSHASEDLSEVSQASEVPFEVPQVSEKPEEVPQAPAKPSEVPQASKELAEDLQASKELAEEPQASEELAEEPQASKELAEEPQASEELTEDLQALEGLPQASEEPKEVPQAPEKSSEDPQATKKRAEDPQAPKHLTEDFQALEEPSEVPQASGESKKLSVEEIPSTRPKNDQEHDGFVVSGNDNSSAAVKNEIFDTSLA